jgi:hypothetical protein
MSYRIAIASLAAAAFVAVVSIPTQSVLCAQVGFGPALSIAEVPIGAPMCAGAWAPPQ